MIDWGNLAWNTLWVMACMLTLSVLAIQQWQTRATGMRLRDGLKQPYPAIILSVAAMLFCIGMLGTSVGQVEPIAWGVLAVLFGVQGFLKFRRRAG